MPPSNKEFNDVNECDYAKEWLDKQKDSSVLYVAPGSEAVLSQQEFSKLAHALERSKLPWLGNGSQLQLLPDRFTERVKSRGIVHGIWVPQVKKPQVMSKYFK